MKEPAAKRPSLLDPEASGGDIAEGGLTFQDRVLLAKIPSWLARDGFTMMIREAMSDGEASFFTPGRGMEREAAEAKGYPLTPSEFWAEIERFRELDLGAPGTYRWFTLVTTGLSRELHPLVNGLRRVRDPYPFYDEGSSVREQSYGDYSARVLGLGKDETIARFLFEKVLIEPNWGQDTSHGDGLFAQNLVAHLPEYLDCSVTRVAEAHQRLGKLLRSRKNQPIARREIESALRVSLPDPVAQCPPAIRVFTACDATPGPLGAVRLDWARFFGGELRTYPAQEDWDRGLMGDLLELKQWVVEHRQTRRIQLSGNRRLSASLAIGSVFSAVAGFSVEMEYRGVLWATDAHTTSLTPAYAIEAKFEPGRGDRLLVAVGILRSIAEEVRTFAQSLGIGAVPLLDLRADRPIESAEQCNLAVREIKNRITEAIASIGANQVDLFLAGPAPLALFLGHRLNATAPVRCYEWLRANTYSATCRLFGRQDGAV